MKTITLISLLLLISCGKRNGDTTIIQAAPTATEAAPTQEELNDQTIDQIINESNVFRDEQGINGQLTPGLLCKVYKYGALTGNLSIGTAEPGQTKITGAVEAFRYVLRTPLNHSSPSVLSFLPEGYRSNPLYQQEVLVDCTGSLVVLETKLHKFTVKSDDNIILTVNNVVTIKRDNNHGVAEDSSNLVLQKGLVYPIRVQYRQYNGSSELKVLQNDEVLDTKRLFH